MNWFVEIEIGKTNTHFFGMLNSGTHVTILGKPEFVTLADEIHNKKVFLKGLKNRWSEDIIYLSQFLG